MFCDLPVIFCKTLHLLILSISEFFKCCAKVRLVSRERNGRSRTRCHEIIVFLIFISKYKANYFKKFRKIIRSPPLKGAIYLKVVFYFSFLYGKLYSYFAIRQCIFVREGDKMKPEKISHLNEDELLREDVKRHTVLTLPNGGGKIVSYLPFKNMQLIFFDVNTSALPDMWKLGFRRGDDGRYLRTLICKSGSCDFLQPNALPA